jgi:outer membrane protein
MKKISLLFLTTIFCTAGLFAQKTPVVATVNMNRVLNDYNAFQAAVEKIKSSVAPVEEEMQKMQSNIQEIVSKGRELEAEIENPSLDEERKAEAEAEILELRGQLQAARIEIQQFNQQAQQLAQQGQQEDLAPLQQKAIEAVEAVAKDKGIDIVLRLNGLAFSADELEITDSVIAVLNASE